MKNLFLLSFLLILVGTAHATIRTVSNSPNNFAQYNSVQAAIDASDIGDTVYVHGSPNDYGAATLNKKKLVIMGPGWSPQNTPLLYAICDFTVAEEEVTIEGFLANTITLGSPAFVNVPKARIVRNYIQDGYIGGCGGGGMKSNTLIEGNYMVNSQVYAASSAFCAEGATWFNTLIVNNVFYNSNGTAAIRDLNNDPTWSLVHNLFYGSDAPAFSNCTGGDIKNNVFVNRDPGSVNTMVQNSMWNNNITFNCSGTNVPWTLNGNSGNDNVENQDPMMVDQASVNTNVSNPLLNFTISGGPANDSGTDGKDMGLLFDPVGYLNWTNSRNSRYPVVNDLIVNGSVTPGGNLQIKLKATQAK